MKIKVFVLAVFVHVAIAELADSKRGKLQLVFPTSIDNENTDQENSSPSLRNENEMEGSHFRSNGVIVPRPYFREQPFEEVPNTFQSNGDTLAETRLPVNPAVNFWPRQKPIEFVNYNQGNLNPSGYNRLFGSPQYYNYNPTGENDYNPNDHSMANRESSDGDETFMGDISGNKRPRNPFNARGRLGYFSGLPYENYNAYNNYGGGLAERIMGQSPSEIGRRFPQYLNSDGTRIVGDISGIKWGHSRNQTVTPKNRRPQNDYSSNAEWTREESDGIEGDEQLPHFPNHGEYF